MRSLFRERPHFQRPHLPFRQKPKLEENLWVTCPNEKCRELLYVREYENDLKVCQRCEHHARLTHQERIDHLLDPNSFVEEDVELEAADPLGFRSLDQTYPEKVAETRAKTGLREAIICGQAVLDGVPLRIAVCDFRFMGASMGSVVGEKLVRAVER